MAFLGIDRLFNVLTGRGNSAGSPTDLSARGGNLAGPPRTAGYRPSIAVSTPYWGGIQGFGYFSLGVVDEMRRDYQARLCTWFKQAPLHTAEFEITANSSRVAAFVEETRQRIWQKSLRVALESTSYGFNGAEVVYKEEGGLVKFDFLKALHPRDVRPFTYQGKLSYIRVLSVDKEGDWQDQSKHGDIELEAATDNRPAKGYWGTYDTTYHPWYGLSMYTASWWPWRLKTMPDGAHESLHKAFYKHGFSGAIIRHPDETYQDQIGAPVVTAQELMQQLGEQMKSGANIALSSRRDEQGQYVYAFEKYGGEIAGDFGQLLEYPELLDRWISRGIGIPDEILTHEGNTGGYSRSNIAWLAFLMMEEEMLNHQLESLEDQIVTPLVKFNFGRSASYEMKPKPLLPDNVNPEREGAPPMPLPGTAGGQPGSQRQPFQRAGAPARPSDGNGRYGQDLSLRDQRQAVLKALAKTYRRLQEVSRAA